MQIWRQYRDICLLALIAAPLGMFVGIIDSMFGWGLVFITEIRCAHPYIWTAFLPVAGLIIMHYYQQLGKECYKGVSLVFEAAFYQREHIPLRLMPLLVGSAWLTHLTGGSAGREGVAVQIGACLGHNIGQRLRIENAPRVLLVAGIAAGFAGLFRTPLAAFFFALEALQVGRLEWRAVFPALVSSLVASSASFYLGMEKFSWPLTLPYAFHFSLIWQILLLGVIFGVVGWLFAYSHHAMKKLLAQAIQNPMARIAVIGAVVAVLTLLCHQGRYSGLGEELLTEAFHGQAYAYDWILKLILTVLTLSVGFQGGEIMPLFAIGAGLGAVLGKLLGMPIPLAAALGYVAVFGAATHTLISPVFIGLEIFGYQYAPYFLVISALAFVFSGDRSVYALQKREPWAVQHHRFVLRRHGEAQLPEKPAPAAKQEASKE